MDTTTTLLNPARPAASLLLEDEATRLALAAARVTAVVAETRTRPSRTALGAARRAAGGIR